MNAKRIGVMALCLCVVPVAVAGGRETEVAAGWGDFSFDLCESVAPSNYMGVGSGWSVAAPLPASIEWTVLGVGKFFAPPVACADFKLLLPLQANGYDISDDPTLYGGAGLLYSGSTWKPDRIVRHGTYHYYRDGKPLSFAVKSELVPLFGRAGFLLKATFHNRTNAPLAVTLRPQVQPGSPAMAPLKNWSYAIPSGGQAAKPGPAAGAWSNDQVRLTMFSESLSMKLSPKGSGTAWVAIVATIAGQEPQRPDKLATWEADATKAWSNRLGWALRDIPVMETDIPGLAEYYRRSLLTGLVSIWENPAFVTNPYVALCGLDGGAMCAYVWDLGGYTPAMLLMELGENCKAIVRRAATLDLAKAYAYAPDGSGVGVGYSYSPFALTRLVWESACHDKPDQSLFETARAVVLKAENSYLSKDGLLDYGTQDNLLEMQGTGYEHFVPSPNAERAWCFDRLADLGAALGHDAQEVRAWRAKALKIRTAVKRKLWDPERKWFKCLYPDGHAEYVYSIQMFNVLRAMPEDAEIRRGLLTHLRPGAFLANYGVQSVSREDVVHFSAFDTDWSGSGAYVGSGPELAQILYHLGESDLAWDVLRRFFWMGGMLPYYPQEMLADRPAVPAHKRANCNSGLVHAQAILYGLAGFDPRIDGSLWVHPHPPKAGRIALKGYRIRGHVVDLYLEPKIARVVCDGREVYQGEPKRIRVFGNRTAEVAAK